MNVDLIEAVLNLCVGVDQPRPTTQAKRFAAVLPKEGAVLVFLPGLADITRLQERLLGSRLYGDASKFLVVCFGLFIHRAFCRRHRRCREEEPNESNFS